MRQALGPNQAVVETNAYGRSEDLTPFTLGRLCASWIIIIITSPVECSRLETASALIVALDLG
jgi:hypothetical protein